ncbi:MAG: hypothetical protein COW02_08560 [Comamonadaceae bacterium CG12_big_fil_rev_8_21_14_0_65_59_15]|nr:MAG: hypothetical protein COW02_08560 [Comamonadaceae bacterium CG12_big_fil_rev_8_21_14_0_65_59_15]
MVQRMHTVYPITAAIAQRGGALRGQFQAQGIVRSAPDMLIAATAIEHQLVLATRNARDFLGCGVQVINPFSLANVCAWADSVPKLRDLNRESPRRANKHSRRSVLSVDASVLTIHGHAEGLPRSRCGLPVSA